MICYDTTSAGHWHLFCMMLATKRGLTIEQTVKLLFVQANAVLDAGVACWDVCHSHSGL